MSTLNINTIRSEFPFLKAAKNKELIYFDNAATTQKPSRVINAISNFYKNENSNIHRSVHKIGALATQKYEDARVIVKDFISANKAEEIVFTSGATESINLVANSFVKQILCEEDIILVSPLEHHANLIPWQMIAKKAGATIKMLPIKKSESKKNSLEKEELDYTINHVELKEFLKTHSDKVKFVAAQHISNVNGGIQDVKKLTTLAHSFNIPVLIDGAQAAAHIAVNVEDIGCDFYCFSGHKIFGPTGVGVLFAKSLLLKQFKPYKYGGGIVKQVNNLNTIFRESPQNLEAGTPNVAGVIGMSEAIQFITEIGLQNIHAQELSLKKLLRFKLEKINDITIYQAHNSLELNNLFSSPIFSFNVANIHHYDLSVLLAENNILVRSGDLCSQTFMKVLGVDGCIRASLSFYNTESEIDSFILSLQKVIKLLKR
jgi:cysteine desulfurase/selenocysteine lyase